MMKQNQVEILKGSVRDEKRESQTLHVVSGTAWISMDGMDIFVKQGQDLRLSRGKYQAVVSNLGNEPVIYEIKH